jgi:hypothetical protein
MAEKPVPMSAATLSIPNFGIRFNDTRFEIERRNCHPSINSVTGLHARIVPKTFQSQRIETHRPIHSEGLTVIELLRSLAANYS